MNETPACPDCGLMLGHTRSEMIGSTCHDSCRREF